MASRKGKGKLNRSDCWSRRSYDEEADSSGSDESEMPKTKSRRGRRNKNQRAVEYMRQSSRSSSTDDHIELPGFHYDKDKKKYFKILPNHLAGHPSTVTREMIAKEDNEKCRIASLRQMSENRRITSIILTGVKHRSSNILDSLVEQRSLGSKSCGQFMRDMIRTRTSHLKTSFRQKVFQESSNMYELLEHMHTLQPSADFTKILGLWSVKTTAVQRIQVIDVKNVSRVKFDENEERLTENSLDIVPRGTAIMKSLSKVTHVCWAPLSTEDNSYNAVLYTTMCILGRFPSLALFRRLDSNTVQEYRSTEFNLGKNAAWTCSWNSFLKRFSIGSENKGLLIDVETRQLWDLDTGGSDVFTQAFSNQDKSLLFSGTRKGMVCCHDTRTSSKHFISALIHDSSVCCVNLMKDNKYVITSTFNGKIKQWDLRMKKVAQVFPGHVNEYSRIPFHLDDTETLLCAAGQDCYTRIWSLKDSTLLHTIPPPFPASRDIIPAVYFSSMWAKSSHAGLLMGIKDEIHFYSL